MLIFSMIFFPYFYSIIIIYRNYNFFFHYFIRTLRDNNSLSEPQFYLSFYHLPIFSTVFPRISFFSHYFTLYFQYSLIFSIVFLIIFPFIVISPSPARKADQGKINIPPLPNYHLAYNP